RGVRSELRAARPVILPGQGGATAAGAARLEHLIGGRTVPVVTTSAGRGVVPEDHPLALRHDGQSGGFSALNALLESSDLVLVLGAKLSHNGTGGFEPRLPADPPGQGDTRAEV